MAYRKVDESSLTAVADAIRAKGGTSAPLTFPDGFAAAIDGITAGGGLPDGVSALASGEYTPSADVSAKVSVAHGLGKTPNFFFVVAEEASLSSANYASYIIGVFGVAQGLSTNNTDAKYYKYTRYGSSSGSSFTGVTPTSSTLSNFATASNFIIDAAATYQLKGGTTYRWVAGVIDGLA